MTPTLEHDVVVVTIPVYNEQRFIAETIASVREQVWQDYAVLISDNGSTDRTEEICRGEIRGDDRFHFVRHGRNRGAAWNFNYTLGASKSPYFMWLGSHDKISPDFLSRHIEALEARPEHSLSYSRTQWIDEAGRPSRITDPSRLSQIRGRPLQRYFEAARRLDECTAINNLLRRSAIGGARLESVAGSDKVMLSQLLFHGTAHLAEGPFYYRRETAHRPDYMERLTGEAGHVRDRAAMIPVYLANLDRLVGWPRRWIVRRLLDSLLHKKLTGRYTTSDRINFAIMRRLGLR